MFLESFVVTVNQNRKVRKLIQSRGWFSHYIYITALFMRPCLLPDLILLHAEGWFMIVVKHKLIAQKCILLSKFQQKTQLRTDSHIC